VKVLIGKLLVGHFQLFLKLILLPIKSHLIGLYRFLRPLI